MDVVCDDFCKSLNIHGWLTGTAESQHAVIRWQKASDSSEEVMGYTRKLMQMSQLMTTKTVEWRNSFLRVLIVALEERYVILLLSKFLTFNCTWFAWIKCHQARMLPAWANLHKASQSMGSTRCSVLRTSDVLVGVLVKVLW